MCVCVNCGKKKVMQSVHIPGRTKNFPCLLFGRKVRDEYSNNNNHNHKKKSTRVDEQKGKNHKSIIERQTNHVE